MEDNMGVIRGVFNDMDLHYCEYVHQKGVHACEVGVTTAGKSLRIKVYLEAEAKVCRIDANPSLFRKESRTLVNVHL